MARDRLVIRRPTVAIVGVGEADAGFRTGRTAGALVGEAIDRALADAGLGRFDVDGLITEGLLTSSTVPMDAVAAFLGCSTRPFQAQLSIGGAGLVGAPSMARLALEAGLATTVVCYYGASVNRSAGGPYAVHASDPVKAGLELPAGWFGQPVYYGAVQQRYEYTYGLAPTQLGAVVRTARDYAARTPGALRPEPLSEAEYEASPPVAGDLRVADCCLANDGAIAYVMTTEERARDLPGTPALVAGVALEQSVTTQTSYFTQKRDPLSTAASASAQSALADADLTIEDVDFAQIYDCFSIALILQLEDIGLVPKGEGAAYAEEVGLGPGSPCPINSHGGLLAHSFTLGGGHLVEAVRQLRGERGPAQLASASVGYIGGLGVPDHASLILATGP